MMMEQQYAEAANQLVEQIKRHVAAEEKVSVIIDGREKLLLNVLGATMRSDYVRIDLEPVEGRLIAWTVRVDKVIGIVVDN